MSVVVTGGAGFIGATLIRALQRDGDHRIVAVDDLSDAGCRARLEALDVAEVLDLRDLRDLARDGDPMLTRVSAVLHQGACTRTDATDVARVTDNNVAYATELLDVCLRNRVPFIYASSAAVYGRSERSEEIPANEAPLNLYAQSKLQLDQAVRARLSTATSQVVGLRYFNVYGPGEGHKGSMASIVTQVDRTISEGRPIRLFAASHGCPDGGHERDFVHVDDVVATVLWFLGSSARSGIYNCGTGTSRTFGEVAELVIDHLGAGQVEYVPMPPSLVDRYQPRTRADLRALRKTGCDVDFRPIEVGVPDHLDRSARGAAQDSAADR